jgi:hypothetical protein
MLAIRLALSGSRAPLAAALVFRAMASGFDEDRDAQAATAARCTDAAA